MFVSVNSRVAQWLESPSPENNHQERKVGDETTFEIDGSGDLVAKFVLHQQIRSAFSRKLWTSEDPDDKVYFLCYQRG